MQQPTNFVESNVFLAAHEIANHEEEHNDPQDSQVRLVRETLERMSDREIGDLRRACNSLKDYIYEEQHRRWSVNRELQHPFGEGGVSMREPKLGAADARARVL